MIAKGKVLHEDSNKKIVFVRVWKDLTLSDLKPEDIEPESGEPWCAYDGDCTLIIQDRVAELIGIMHVPDGALWSVRHQLADEFGFDRVWGDRWEWVVDPKHLRGGFWHKRRVEMPIRRAKKLDGGALCTTGEASTPPFPLEAGHPVT